MGTIGPKAHRIPMTETKIEEQQVAVATAGKPNGEPTPLQMMAQLAAHPKVNDLAEAIERLAKLHEHLL